MTAIINIFHQILLRILLLQLYYIYIILLMIQQYSINNSEAAINRDLAINPAFQGMNHALNEINREPIFFLLRPKSGPK